MIGQEDSTHYPSIVFTVQGELFSVNSRYVSTILQLPEFQTLPDTPAYITGIFSYRDSSITMLDMRTVLNMETMEQEFSQFTKMLDDRKQDHIRWVNELERCMTADEHFTMATDPHQCALGKWYDQFHSKSNAVNFHLAKLVEPHNQLHAAAIEAEQCNKDCANCKRSECLSKILDRIRMDNVPKIMAVLEDAKEVFRNAVYNEMVLVLTGDTSLGLVVDEVLSVGELVPVGGEEAFKKFQFSPYLSRIVRREGFSELILEIDVPKLVAAAEFAAV